MPVTYLSTVTRHEEDDEAFWNWIGVGGKQHKLRPPPKKKPILNCARRHTYKEVEILLHIFLPLALYEDEWLPESSLNGSGQK
jgi:hypothetical protein